MVSVEQKNEPIGEPTGKELYDLRKKQREVRENRVARMNELFRKTKRYTPHALLSAIGVVFVGGVTWFMITRPRLQNLPPTTTQGHTENMPDAHIMDKLIPDSVQRHMIEHADGKGKPSIIVQYNCKKYTCEPDLIKKLTDFVKKYPDNVYLAPNNYDGKIILTKLGTMKILENFDEQVFRDFIGS